MYTKLWGCEDNLFGGPVCSSRSGRYPRVCCGQRRRWRPPQQPKDSHVQGDTHDHGDVDNRPGAAQPSTQQRQLAAQGSSTVRWNKYGTPATLVPKPGAQRRSAAFG
ncbi:hypothetical protein [Kibdelosporangium philippinense]|uniref:hypothetical protein n=1 Tax=Kibdelosporangium philippinense TaxID=211113 RepID=UPI00362129CD